MAWLGTWAKRKAIKYGSTKPVSNLIDFQKLINITSDTDIGGELPSTAKFAVTLADGSTTVPFGVVKFSSSAGSCTTSLRVKTTASSSASTGDVWLYLYYDNSQTNTENKSGVFTSEYKTYLTLDQNPTGSANDITDWTSNASHGTSNGSMASGVTGKVGNALTFDGSNDYVAMPTDFIGTWTGGSDLYCNVWFKTSTYGGILGQQGTADPFSSPGGWVPSLYIDTSGFFRTSLFWHGAVALTTDSVNYADGNWHNAVVIYSGGTETLYIDGSSVANRTGLSQSVYSGNYFYYIGAAYWNSWTSTTGGTGVFNGLIDEFRFANGSGAVKSVDWIAYQYADENNNSNTTSLGTQETLSSPSSSPRLPLLVNGRSIGFSNLI